MAVDLLASPADIQYIGEIGEEFAAHYSKHKGDQVDFADIGDGAL